MKKEISVFLAICILFCCVSCSAKENSNTKENRTDYYNPAFFLLPFEDFDEGNILEGATEPSKKQMDICNQVIEDISRKYEIIKGKPTIKCLPDECFNPTESLKATARYEYKLNMILIPESFDESGKSYFCHEYFHYMSDCDNDEALVGIEYMLENEQERYLIGKALNEGLANYFSTQVYEHPKGTCIYEYETHVAAELSIAFGEQNLFKAYTTSNWESIKNCFDATVKDLYQGE